ncbi:MAG TPA: hypothetical protein VF113_17255 [Stellaceae bacterium]
MGYISMAANVVRAEDDPKVISAGPSSLSAGDRLGRGLGWFSLGLGLTQLLAPGVIAKPLGLSGNEGLLRAYGAREIGAGVLSLSTEKRVGLWSRVAGDVLDMTTLMTALRRDNPKRNNVKVALGLVAGVTALDVIAAQRAGGGPHRGGSRRRYADRSGFPQGVQKARGAARKEERGPRPSPRHSRAAPSSVE